jgi:hypothetical protein
MRKKAGDDRHVTARVAQAHSGSGHRAWPQPASDRRTPAQDGAPSRLAQMCLCDHAVGGAKEMIRVSL